MKILKLIYLIQFILLFSCKSALKNNFPEDKKDIFSAKEQIKNTNYDLLVNYDLIGYYSVIDSFDYNSPRKFGTTITCNNGDYFICYEFGQGERLNDSIRCLVVNGETLIVDRKHDYTPRRKMRQSPVAVKFIDKDLYLFYSEIDTAVYQYFDNTRINFNYKGDRYFSFLQRQKLDADLHPLGDPVLIDSFFYGVAMDIQALGKDYIAPFYEFSQNQDSTQFGFLELDASFTTKNKNIFTGEYTGTEPFKFMEPSVAINSNNDLVFSLRGSTEYVSFTNFKDGNWTDLKNSEAHSPSSMNRIYAINDNIYLIHNNIKTNKMSPRNRLDLSILDTSFGMEKQAPLLSHSIDFLSNFNCVVNSKNQIVCVGSRLHFIKKHRVDSLFLIIINV